MAPPSGKKSIRDLGYRGTEPRLCVQSESVVDSRDPGGQTLANKTRNLGFREEWLTVLWVLTNCAARQDEQIQDVQSNKGETRPIVTLQ